jgi:hypothetical protein
MYTYVHVVGESENTRLDSPPTHNLINSFTCLMNGTKLIGDILQFTK